MAKAKLAKKVARKPAKKAGAKKTAVKKATVKARVKTEVKKAANKAQKVVAERLTELLDRRLLEIATKQYARIAREVAKGRKRLDRKIDDEKKLAVQLGERIIAKAREVKETLIRK